MSFSSGSTIEITPWHTTTIGGPSMNGAYYSVTEVIAAYKAGLLSKREAREALAGLIPSFARLVEARRLVAGSRK